MGGALALHAALDHRISGFVLLAPFWSLGDALAGSFLAAYSTRLSAREASQTRRFFSAGGSQIFHENVWRH